MPQIPDSAKNGFIGGAASVAGIAAMGAVVANPLPAALIATSAATYAYVKSPEVRECAHGTVTRTWEVLRDGVGEPKQPNDESNEANRITNFAVLTGIGVSVLTANPIPLYLGVAVGTGAQAVRAAAHGRCSIL